jgi:peptidoglycan/LPS O-acetylase OafA/YrhL
MGRKMFQSRRSRILQGLAGFAFLVAAVVNWWNLAEEGTNGWTLVPAIGFTLACVLLLAGLIRRRRLNGG